MTTVLRRRIKNTNLSNATKVLRVWKRGQQKLKQFWELWRNDNLLNLRERTQMSLKGLKKPAHNTPQLGNVVLIKENLPCGKWRVGVIHEPIRGKDQMIWSAQVLVSPNWYLHRTLSLLYPIECPGNKGMQAEHNENETPSSDNNEEDSENLSGDITNNEDDEVDIQEGDKEQAIDDSSRTVRRDIVGRPV